MGPPGLKAAILKGGPTPKDFPMEQDKHLEGIIEKGWLKKKVEDSELIKFSEVSTFIRVFPLIMHILTEICLDMATSLVSP